MLPHRGCISHLYSCLELDPWKDYISRLVKTDVAELCGEARWIMRRSNRENKRPKWQPVSTLFEKEPYSWFSIGSILNDSALFNKMKYFVSGQTNESKRFFWQNWFWWTTLLLGVLGFFLPSPAPFKIFHPVKRSSQITQDLVISQNHLGCTFKRLKGWSLGPVRAQINLAIKTR